MKTVLWIITLCCSVFLLCLACARAGQIDGDLLFEQDGKDLVITGTGFTTRGLFIVKTGWHKKNKDEVILTYVQVYNKDTVRRSVMPFQVTWRLKNRSKGERKFTVQKSGVVMLTPEELGALLNTAPKTEENQQEHRGDVQ
ncbi:MAG: hypothetical protein GVY36_16165 [Verrucomicrobia bacterium]|nr:hypothetical protein [Verrucomicrobiota bacterium]